MRPPNIQLAEREGNPGERTLLRVCTAAGPPGMKSLGGREGTGARSLRRGKASRQAHQLPSPEQLNVLLNLLRPGGLKSEEKGSRKGWQSRWQASPPGPPLP